MNNSTQSARHHAIYWCKEYLFGFILNLTIVQVVKVIVGAPRPHFFDTCGPQEADTCVASEYVSSYTCTRAHWLNQSNKSFPSGHTSLALHAGVFIAYYLHRRAGGARVGAVRLAQAASVLAAVVCSVSRVWDRRHHWWDVIGGAVLSAPVLLYTIVKCCENFECPSPKEENGKRNDHLNTQKESVGAS